MLYGQRGTGKTHAFRYLESVIAAHGDIPIYIDLRTVGSPEGLFAGDTVRPTERAARLLVDLLNQVHDTVLEAVLEDEALIADPLFVNRLDTLLGAITTVRVSGEVEVAQEGERKASENVTDGAAIKIGPKPELELRIGENSVEEERQLTRETRRGTESLSLHFGDISRP